MYIIFNKNTIIGLYLAMIKLSLEERKQIDIFDEDVELFDLNMPGGAILEIQKEDNVKEFECTESLGDSLKAVLLSLHNRRLQATAPDTAIVYDVLIEDDYYTLKIMAFSKYEKVPVRMEARIVAEILLHLSHNTNYKWHKVQQLLAQCGPQVRLDIEDDMNTNPTFSMLVKIMFEDVI